MLESLALDHKITVLIFSKKLGPRIDSHQTVRLRGNERTMAYAFSHFPIRATASCISAAEPA